MHKSKKIYGSRRHLIANKSWAENTIFCRRTGKNRRLDIQVHPDSDIEYQLAILMKMSHLKCSRLDLVR